MFENKLDAYRLENLYNPIGDTISTTSYPPQLYEFANFCRQTAQLIAGQIERSQAN